MTLALDGKPDNVIPLRRNATYRPDFAALAREQIVSARSLLGQTVEEFAATLGQFLTWFPTPEAVRGWESAATPTGDALVAAQFLSRATAGDLLRMEVKL
ncbi:hypothetical protein [Dactylosporangium sp. NPDC051484]|uniref:hypothetical protein n=1 Tax=Dactylosporangium sp. NPDC051484 TaxID=3154942 RepID=UPI00344B68AD